MLMTSKCHIIAVSKYCDIFIWAKYYQIIDIKVFIEILALYRYIDYSELENSNNMTLWRHHQLPSPFF